MFAIVETGGKQYRVEKGMKLDVEKLDYKEGEVITLGKVVLVSDGAELKIGTPVVAGAAVSAKIIAQIKGEKLVIYKMKAKKRYRRKTGHRQKLTTVEITDIKLSGTKAVKAEVKTEKIAEESKEVKKEVVKKTASKKKTVAKKPAKKAA